MKVGDLINNDGTIEIATETSGNGVVTEKEPLKDYVMRCYMMEYKGQPMSISDIVDSIMNEIINKATNQ